MLYSKAKFNKSYGQRNFVKCIYFCTIFYF